MGSGIDGDEHFKCSTWKVDFYANFHPINDFFFVGTVVTPQKLENEKIKVTSITLRA